jgi:hypothetical protein
VTKGHDLCLQQGIDWLKGLVDENYRVETFCRTLSHRKSWTKAVVHEAFWQQIATEFLADN